MIKTVRWKISNEKDGKSTDSDKDKTDSGNNNDED